MSKESVTDNTLKSLRSILFRELIDLRNNDVESQHATAVVKVTNSIISTYSTEIFAVKVANELKEKNLSYAGNLKAIQTEDTTNENITHR